MTLLKSIYEFFGTPYPKLSLIVVMILAALVAGGVWLFAAKQVAKDHKVTIAPSQVSGPASTTGDQSPANSGSHNTTTYGTPPTQPPPKQKE